jgi:hypothetical protein
MHLDFAGGHLEVIAGYIVKPAGNFFKLQGKKGLPLLGGHFKILRATKDWTAYFKRGSTWPVPPHSGR